MGKGRRRNERRWNKGSERVVIAGWGIKKNSRKSNYVLSGFLCLIRFINIKYKARSVKGLKIRYDVIMILISPLRAYAEEG